MFQVTAIGLGLTGYRPEQTAPMFAGLPVNCQLPEVFPRVLARGEERGPGVGAADGWDCR